MPIRRQDAGAQMHLTDVLSISRNARVCRNTGRHAAQMTRHPADAIEMERDQPHPVIFRPADIS